jgi:hypothetical protein
VIAGQTVELTITAYEKSAGDIKDRPAISFTVK